MNLPSLTASFLALAALLDLPEKEASESAQVVAAVQRWLQMTSGYLLILDNADNLALAREFLPTKTSGHVLLKTRAQITGSFARRLEVETLPPEQGVLFNLAELYRAQGKYGEAEPLYVRALTIHGQQLEAEHPSTATSLNNLAGLYESQGKYGEAEPLYVRALEIHEQQLGREDPQTLQVTGNYLTLLSKIHTGGDIEALLQLLVQRGTGDTKEASS